MSDITVTVQAITDIVPHPNADRLEIAKILGTQTIIGKGQFQRGDLVVYFPPDICLPADVSAQLGVDKYLKTALFRGEKFPCKVAACRLRGVPSYGFVAALPDLPGLHPDYDLTEHYQAAKYEPPPRTHRSYGGGTGEVWGGLAPEPINFHHYTDIQNHWKYHRAMPAGTPVRVTEKIHGTNSRVALLKVDDEWNFYCGSHKRCRRQYVPGEYQIGYDAETHEAHQVPVESVYWSPLHLPGVMDLLTHLCAEQNDVIIFGELYGPGVQDMDYGVPAGEIGWRVYDISVNGRYLGWVEVSNLCCLFKVETVPVLYTGPFDPDRLDEWTNGPTTVAAAEALKTKFKGREGCVITPLIETHSDYLGGRLILKSVSADYRDRKGASDEGEL